MENKCWGYLNSRFWATITKVLSFCVLFGEIEFTVRNTKHKLNWSMRSEIIFSIKQFETNKKTKYERKLALRTVIRHRWKTGTELKKKLAWTRWDGSKFANHLYIVQLVFNSYLVMFFFSLSLSLDISSSSS